MKTDPSIELKAIKKIIKENSNKLDTKPSNQQVSNAFADLTASLTALRNKVDDIQTKVTAIKNKMRA